MATEFPIQKRRGRGKSKLKRTAMTRGAEALLAAGQTLKRVEVNPSTGVINYILGQPEEAGSTTNPWDSVLPHAAVQKRPS